MTKQEAMDEGFEFVGRFGLARVYLTDPRNGDVGCAGRGPISEFILDVQEGILKVAEILGWYVEVFTFYYHAHIDGTEIKESEL